MPNMSLSDSSSLSSAPLTDDESVIMTFDKNPSITKYFKQQSPPTKRPASPPHEYVLADNPDIAVSSQYWLSISSKSI
jgi:hypothetical protein